MKRTLSYSVLVGLLGVGMMAGGGFVASWTADWTASALLTVGSAAALAVAFYWLNRTFDTQLKDVKKRVKTTEEQVQEVGEDLEEVRAEVEEQGHDLAQLLRDRLAPQNHEVVQLFNNAAENPSASALAAAIDAGRQKGSLSSKAPVVPLRGAEEEGYVVRVDSRGGQLTLHLGRVKGPIPFAEPITVTDDTLVESLEKLGGQVQDAAGDVHPEPWRIFEDVVDLLKLGRSCEARKTLFARVHDWGACVGHVVSLDDRSPQVRVRAGRNPSNPGWNIPKDLSSDERLSFWLAQELVLKSDDMFFIRR